MRKQLLLPLITGVLGSDQIPLVSEALTPWSLNFSSPTPHLFASLYTLTQQWSNTLFPNGHTIALVEVQAGEIFYHGRQGPGRPPNPEWLAFDVEMAYAIMGGTRHSWLLKYATTRKSRMLYFDGESATLFGRGRMDSQMGFIWGNVSGPANSGEWWDPLGMEFERANGLCALVEELGIEVDGFVRMNAGFEAIWCNFDKGLELIDEIDMVVPLEDTTTTSDGKTYTMTRTATETGIPTPYLPPPNWRDPDGEPFLTSQSWGWFESAARHYKGEDRMRVIGSPASFYGESFIEDKKLLNLSKDGTWLGADDWKTGLKDLGRRRRRHLPDTNEFERVRKEVIEMKDEGTDWVGVARRLAERTARHLLAVEGALHGDTWKADVRGLNHLWLVAFWEYPRGSETAAEMEARIEKVVDRCVSDRSGPGKANKVIHDTMDVICRVLVDLQVDIENDTVTQLSAERKILELKAWLGWEGEWQKCPKCDDGQLCYIPMWPMLLPTGDQPGHGRPPHDGPPHDGPPHDGPPRDRPPHGHPPGTFPAPVYPHLWDPVCVKLDFFFHQK